MWLESICGVGLAFRRQHTLVLRDVHFAVRAGSALHVQGANGSGKTTLLKLIAGLIAPTNGGFVINGRAVPPGQQNEYMSGRTHYVAARTDGLDPHATVDFNLRFWNTLYRGTDEQLERAVERFDLRHLLSRPVSSLSTGQRRAISLARISAAYCQVWLLDEPVNALDRRMTAIVEDAIRAHRRAGGIVFVVSHTDVVMEDAVTLRL